MVIDNMECKYAIFYTQQIMSIRYSESASPLLEMKALAIMKSYLSIFDRICENQT